MFTKLKAIFIKARIWGVKGVVAYLKNALARRRLQSFLCHNAQKYIYANPTKGITLIGRFTNGGSASKVLRDFACALKKTNIPYQTFNTDYSSSISTADAEGILTPISEFRFNRLTHVVEIYPTILPKSLSKNHARIAFWEFESGFLLAYPDMPLEKHVIAMSDFNANYLQRELPSSTTIHKILYPFHFPPAHLPKREEIRQRYHIPKDAFVVLFNFDLAGAFNRKNPDGALRAFAKAFPGDSNAQLVFKVKSAKDNPGPYNRLIQLTKDLTMVNRVHFITEFLPEADLYGLTNACDVYLSLHRGEGFGITLAEAMAMGKPVVCTDWSATREFCKPDCTIPIPCRMVPVSPDQIDHPYYREVKEWADPDIEAAAKALTELNANPSLRKKLGERATASIQSQFSIERFRETITSFLNH